MEDCEYCGPDCEYDPDIPGSCPMMPDHTPNYDYGPATDVRSAWNMSAREGYHL